ncbi:MAG TPA: hypothetical protein PLE72_04135, partial [Azospira sp.]|nr:hypothetical protein [Azospira sp.]
AATLTVGPNVTVSGSGTGSAIFGYSADEAIDFKGVLNANVAGKTWYLGGFANTGNINVSAGTVRMDTYSGTGSWTNTSTVGKGIAVSGTGVLNLVDAFNASTLGNIAQSGGGAVNLIGTMTLDQASTNLSTAGLTALTIDGGTVAGGGNTLTSNGSLALTATGYGTFSNLTLATDLTVSGTFYLTNGLTLATNATTLNPATVTLGTGGDLRYTGTQTLGGTGNLVFGGASTTWFYRNGAAATLTVGPNITVSGSGTGSAVFGYSADEAINFQGVLNANVAGKTWYLGGFASTGNINVSAGTVRMDTYSGTGAWTNTSTVGKGIAVSGTGVLDLSDGFTTTGIGRITRSGGTINISGTLDNTGQTLDIGAGGPFGAGGLSSLTGRITNGTIISGDGTLLNSPSGSLDGVTIGSNFGFAAGGYANIYNSLLLTNGITVNKGNTEWYFRSGGTQNLAMVSGSATINTASGGLYAGYGVAGQTLQIGSGITYQGYGYISDSAAATIVNNGTLIANTTGQTLTINPTSLTNNGTLRVTAGTLTVSPTNWTNSATGSIEAQGGTLTLNGSNLGNSGALSLSSGSIFNLGGTVTLASLGTFTRAAGSTFNLTGTLDLGGATLDIGSGGAFKTGGLSSLTGTIANGTLVSNDGTLLNSSGGSLDGITLGSSLGFTSGTTSIYNSLQLASGITVNKGASTWYFRTTGVQNLATVSGGATINTAGGGLYAGWGVSGQTLQIGSGITYQGYGTISDSSVATIVNSGTLIANTVGQTLSINPTNLTNSGTLQVTAGTLSVAPTNWTNTGTISIQGGSFSLSGSNLVNTGTTTVDPGATLTLTGNLTLASLGTFSRGAGSSINLSGTLALGGGTLDIGSAGAFGTGGLTTLTGTIANGTIVSNDGTLLNSSGGALDGITLGSSLGFTSGGTHIYNNLQLASGITVNKGANTWYFRSTGAQNLTTVSGSATINTASGGLYAGWGVAGQTLQIGSGITYQGYGTISDSSVATIVNNGTLIG